MGLVDTSARDSTVARSSTRPQPLIGDLNGGSKSKLEPGKALSEKPAEYVQGSLLGQHMSFAWTSRFDFNGENMQQVACFGNRKAALGYALCRISESVSSAVRDF